MQRESSDSSDLTRKFGYIGKVAVAFRMWTHSKVGLCAVLTLPRVFVFPYSTRNEVLTEAAAEMDRVDVLFHKSMYLLTTHSISNV